VWLSIRCDRSLCFAARSTPDSGAATTRVRAGSRLGMAFGIRGFFSVAVSRSERVNGSGVVYAGTEPSAVLRSEDAGKTWQECTGLSVLPSASEWSFPPRPETHHVRWIEPNPYVAGPLLVAIEAGALIRSPDAGKSWRDRTPDGPRDTHQLVTHLSNPARLYAAAGDGYFESRDGGETWQCFEEGLRHKYLWSVAVDAADANNIILSAATSARHSHYDKHPESHIYHRTEGSPWKEIRDGLPDPRGRHSSVLASPPVVPGEFFAAWERDVFSLNRCRRELGSPECVTSRGFSNQRTLRTGGSRDWLNKASNCRGRFDRADLKLSNKPGIVTLLVELPCAVPRDLGGLRYRNGRMTPRRELNVECI